ncbi:hypothetical protein Peur_004276 [Populus x canadensis]
MAFGDGLSRFSSISIALIILTFVLMPLVHSSRSCKFKIIPFFLSLVQVRILCVYLASLNIRFTNMACNLIMFAMHETTVAAGNRARASAQDIHQSYKITRMGKGASSFVTDEESEREVPTGPDPLHHNNNPTTRP